MKTISQDQFVDYVSEALPELISSIMRKDTSAVSKGRVSVPQFWALHYISQQDGRTVNELATALNRSKSSTSALLQRLEKNGLVKRQRSEHDQRMVNVSLTKKGRRIIAEVVANRKQGIHDTYTPLTATERTQYLKLMNKILKHAGQGLAILLLSTFTLPAEGQTNSYTLNQSIRIGLKRSLSVANAARQREIAKTTKKRAVAAAWPHIAGIADYSLYDPNNLTESGSTMLGAEASWKVFSGGRTLAAIRAAKAYRQLTTYQERRIRETQVRDVALAYHGVQLAKAKVVARAQSVEQLAGFEAETRKKYEAGAVSEFEWLSAKVSLANERPRLIVAKNERTLAVEQFRNLTYIDDETFGLSDPLEFFPIEVDLDGAIARGLRKRPDLQEKAAAVALRKEDISQQKSDYYPIVNLVANYGRYDPDPYSFLGPSTGGWQSHWSAGIRANWNLFDGGVRRANLGESKLNMAIEEDELRDMERAVALDIRAQWLRGRDAAEVIEATTENVELATRALEIARSRFDAGLGTHLEVTQANVELANARLARSQALYEHMAAVVSMKHAAGILLEEYEK